MIKSVFTMLALTSLAVTVTAQTTATLTDIGVNQPAVGPNDIYQTNWQGQASSPDGLNYYVDNASPPGETFTTGSNPAGYIVDSLALQTAGNSGSLPAGGQAYLLRFYAVSEPSNATLIATYTSTNNFTFVDDDWIQWTGLKLSLPPNTSFAYSFGRIGTGAGWENMGSGIGASGPPPIYVDGQASAAGGDVALIPTGGGDMSLGSSSNFVATFDLGLTVASGAPQADAPLFAPSSSVTSGTAVTASALAVGSSPLGYQWQTDGGSGGALTNIPGASSATLAINTANANPGPYAYAVVVTNASGSVTSAVSYLGVRYPTVAATLTDAGQNITSGLDDISQFIGGGSGNSLNYYDDNGASHGGNYTGQTFKTGTNSQGYYIDSVAIQTGNGSDNSTTSNQFYHLFIYSMSGNTATLLAHYTNSPLLSYTFGDWLVWSGFSVALKPNSTYAYAFGRDTSGYGWAGLNYSPTNAPGPYTNGVICIIPQNGGTITPGAGYSAAVFDLGMLPIGVGPNPAPFANPIAASPGSFVLPGTQVKLSENASGEAPLHYYWQADGGTGTITNIPGNDASNLVVNTTGLAPGLYQFDVVVSNSFGFYKSAVQKLTVLFADTNALLEDIGSATPPVNASDVSQPVYGTSQDVGGSPDGLNYYFDNGNPPGQVFKTGANAQGYVLSTVSIPVVDEYNTPANGQDYFLRLYSVSGGNATLLAVFDSEPNFMYVGGDWLRWSGLDVPLAANSTYAYTFGRDPAGSGWGSLGCVSNSPPIYNGGACLIPPNGGGVVYSTSKDQDATFIAGMALAQDPVVAPPSISPEGTIYAGSTITLSAAVNGPGPYTYQWMTDGGSGGSLTNIPGATGATLTVNTTPLGGVNASYAVVVQNSAGSTTSDPRLVSVAPASAPLLDNDINPPSETMFVGGTVNYTAFFEGSQPITYQWTVDKGSGPTNIPGATGTNFTLANVTAADAGTYAVTAKNSQGTTLSASATLSIVPVVAAGTTVNFQWLSTENNSDAGDYSGPGVPGFGSGDYWNQITGPADGTPGTYGISNAIASNGSTQTGFQWSLTTAYSWDWWTNSGTAIPLLDSAASAYYPNPQPFVFTLPSGMYNIAIFTADGNEAFSHDSTNTVTLAGAGSQVATPESDTAFIQGQTYLVFTNVPVPGSTLVGTWAGASASHDLGSINGAQVMYLGPYTAPNITLSATLVGPGQVKLEWTGGTLLQSASLKGPWTTNSSGSPLTIPASGPQMFFKVLAQ